MHLNYEVSDRNTDTCCNSRVETKKVRTLHNNFRAVKLRRVEENAILSERLRVNRCLK